MITPIDFDDLRPGSAGRAAGSLRAARLPRRLLPIHGPPARCADRVRRVHRGLQDGPAVRAGRDDLAHRSDEVWATTTSVTSTSGWRCATGCRVPGWRTSSGSTPHCWRSAASRRAALRPGGDRPRRRSGRGARRHHRPPRRSRRRGGRVAHRPVHRSRHRRRACRLQPTVASIFDPDVRCVATPIWSPPERHGWIPVVTRSPRATDPPAFRSPPERDRAVPAVAG